MRVPFLVPRSLRALRLLPAVAVLLLAQPFRAAVAQTPSLGKISFPNSGSPAAQPAFIRGVLLLHSFEYDDAIAAFREAQKIDPSFAMAYWGEALSYNQPLWYNESIDKARAALGRLAPTREARQAKAPTAREKGFVDAVERLFGEGAKAVRDRAYADRMAELHRQFPDDDEATVFYALALLSTIGLEQRNPAISLQAGALASAVLKKNPLHPGAAHVALHAYDDGEHAAMGLDAARIYAKIAPDSSHARHMPSHVFVPLGMWDEAAASDESAFAASVNRVGRLKLTMAQADFHSLGWLHYEYLQQGRYAKAREAEQKVRDAMTAASRPADPAHPAHPAHESEIGRGYGEQSLKSELASMRARRIVESGSWSEMQGQGSFDNIDELFALGEASVRLGDVGRAEAALEHLGTASTTVPDADVRDVAKIMAAEVDGLLKLARGERAAGLAALARAAAFEAARPKPVARPYPIKPATELNGEALLASGDAAAAMVAFQKSLARTPRRAMSLLGLARAAAKAGKSSEAARAATEFLSVWHLADQNRPELAEMRVLLRSR